MSGVERRVALWRTLRCHDNGLFSYYSLSDPDHGIQVLFTCPHGDPFLKFEPVTRQQYYVIACRLSVLLVSSVFFLLTRYSLVQKNDHLIKLD
jgi:hypothetical protein